MGGRPRRDDGAVAERVLVWFVDLIRDPHRDRRGTLSVDAGALVFESSDRSLHLRIGVEEIRKVKRLRGSPILMVLHERDGVDRRSAFYFAQPPPLDLVTGQTEPTSVLATLRTSKRRARRKNVGYLGTTNRQKKALVAEWERAIRAAIGRR